MPHTPRSSGRALVAAEEAPVPAVPPGLLAALQGVDLALDAPRRPGVALGNWRWIVRQRLAEVRVALSGEVAGPEDGWLAARGGPAFAERNQLLSRLTAAGPAILETADIEAARSDVKTLVMDIHRHLHGLEQRGRDSNPR